MKVVFFGNHTVGIKSLETLLKHTDVAGVVAHPFDPEDGKNYSSVYDYALSKKLTAIRGKPKENKVFDLVKKIKPDLIWVTDYRYLLPMELISESIKGGINLHPSLLPKYRGRASLNWAILNGEKEIGLTAHFLDKEADTGDIIKQEKIFLYKNENIGDVINKILPIYSTITKDVILKFKNNNIKRTPQDNTLASYFPARKPKDGLIDWSKSAEKIFNFVRSISHPYPGAFSNTVNGRIYIWKSSIVKNKIEKKKSDTGKIVKYVKGKMFIVSCGEGFLKITDWTIIPENSLKIYVGLKFQDISSKKKLIDDNLQNINFYEALLKKYGKSYKALNWGSLENQKKRFEVIADVGLKAGDSILDVGCGLSDFYGWIRKKNTRYKI